MNTRTRTIASFFSIAMAAMLVGAVVTSQIQHPTAAQASPAVSPAQQGVSSPTGPASRSSITLDTFRDIARTSTKGVVNINTRKTVKRQRGADPFREFFGDDMMERFFGPQGRGRGDGEGQRETQRSLGSGFVIDREGYILTNRHVIEGADEVNVTFPDGKRYEASIVGRDPRTDVALLKISAPDPLTVLELADSDQTEPGEWVMAIGNPFGLGGNSVTVGVVSYRGRPLQLGTQGTSVDMIQTDAAINPGNSGGPLLDSHGRVVGINTLIITQGPAQSAGVGFAVPINVAKEILPQLREKGKVVRGWLGVQIQPVSDDMARSFGLKEAKGALIGEVTPGSPAEKAGLRPEDVVTGVDGRVVEDNSDLSRYIASRAPGSSVRLKVLRGGEAKDVTVTLGTFPDGEEQAVEDEAKSQRLGMTLRDLTPDLAERLDLPRGTRGALVSSVEPGEAAEEAGLQRGDVIVSVNGVAVDGVDAFEREIDRAKASGLARLRVNRGGSHSFILLKLE
jgi:serine protease Do